MTDGMEGRAVVPFSPGELENLRWCDAHEACLRKEREHRFAPLIHYNGEWHRVYHDGNLTEPLTGMPVFVCQFCATRIGVAPGTPMCFSSIVPDRGYCVVAVFACQEHMPAAEACIRRFREKMETH